MMFKHVSPLFAMCVGDWRAGVPAALLCPQTRTQAEGDELEASPLKVLLSGDVMGLPEEKLSEAGFSQPQLQTFRAAKV